MADLQKLKADTLKIKRHDQNNIAGEIQLDKEKLLFFSVPYDRGWHALVNGEKRKILNTNIGFLGLLLKPGSHKIELYYEPPFLYWGLIISIIPVIIYGSVFMKKNIVSII